MGTWSPDVRERVLDEVDIQLSLQRGAVVRAQHAGRVAQRALLADQRLDAHVHLEHGKAAGQPAQQLVAHGLAGRLVGRVAIHADGVAKLAAGQDVSRHAVGLAGQVHQRHLHRAHPAALARVVAKLFDLAEQPVHVARVLAQQPVLQHQREGLARAVAHLAVAAQALVGVQADQGKAPAGPADRGRAHVRDF
jgi:hypothetical protein